MIGTDAVVLGSIPVTGKGSYRISFKPTGSSVQLWILGAYDIVLKPTCYTYPVTTQETYLVDICDENKDRYRFGFNGQEKDNELKGIGNSLSFTHRMYDSRLGRFLARDPLAEGYPFYSIYQFAGNTPIMAIDIEGKEPGIVLGSPKQVQTIKNENSLIKKQDQNWVAFEFVNLDDALVTVKAHKDQGNTIKAIYIQSHGHPGAVDIFAGPNNVVNTSSVNQDLSNRNLSNEDDESLSATKVDMYMSEMAKINAIRNPKQREKTHNNLRNEMMPVSKEIEKFIELTNLIDDGGTIILGGCNAAYVQFTGDLVSSVSKLLNNRIKVVANQDETGDTMDKETKKGSGIYNSSFLNKGRSFYLNRGWSTSDFTSNTQETNKNLQLNSQSDQPIYEFNEKTNGQ